MLSIITNFLLAWLVALNLHLQVAASAAVLQPTELSEKSLAVADGPAVERINGGQQVNESVPYQVSLQVRRRGGWQHFCGGSIVSAHYVLTAAHCVDRLKVANVSIVVGTLNWKTGGQRHKAVAKSVHPQYASSPRIINDIALLKVSPPFQLSRANVSAINLGTADRIGDKVAVRLTGWGSTTSTTASAKLPDQLQVLNYRTISNEECAKKGFRVTANEICALAAPGLGACVGDSGGALIVANGVVSQLVGIVSYGSTACAQGRPDVYTRVSSFLPYINQVLNEDQPKVDQTIHV